MFRVLQVLPCEPYNLAYGGPITLITKISRYLRGKGCDVTLFAPDLLTQRRRWFGIFEEDYEGSPLLIFATFFRYRWSSFNPSAVFPCLFRIKNYDFVIIHSYRTFLGTLAAWGAKAHNIPYILIPHGSCHNVSRSRIKKWLYDCLIGRRLLRNSFRVIFNSRQELTRAQGIAPAANSGIIPHALLVPDSCAVAMDVRGLYGFPPGAKVLLSLGRVNATKNIELAVETLARLPGEVHLLVVGELEEKRYTERLKRLARSLGVYDRVCFAGPVYGEKKFSLIRGTDVLVSTSKLESFGLSVAEAISLGVPAVFPETAGIAEFLPQHPLALPTELKIESIAARINEALKLDRHSLPQLPAMNRGWDAVLEQYWNLLEEAVQARRIQQHGGRGETAPAASFLPHTGPEEEVPGSNRQGG